MEGLRAGGDMGRPATLSPSLLAYVGDAVYELYVRQRAACRDVPLPLRLVHRTVVGVVRAEAQADALQRLEPLLTREESDVARKGRNAAAGSSSPSPAIRCASTALEALVGYLYLEGRWTRLDELLGPVVEAQLAGELRRGREAP